MRGNENDPVFAIFSDAVNTVGGLGCMVSERRLGWLPELLESAYIVQLQESEHRTLEDISVLLGVTRDTVETVLTGPPDLSSERIRTIPPDDTSEREHFAGGLAKKAYSALSSPTAR